MDRKTKTILTQIDKNAEDLEDFKATQFTGSDSTKIQLLSTTDPWHVWTTMVPNSRWQFYFQLFDSTSMTPEDASYNSGLINVYVDAEPTTSYTPPKWLAMNSTSLSGGYSTPILLIGTNAIDYENSHYWSITLRNIDTVNHNVYVKGFINTTMNPNAVFWSWGGVDVT